MAPLRALRDRRGQLFPFAPVALGCGIGLWFGLIDEPPPWAYLACLVTLPLAYGLSRIDLLHAPALALGLVAMGFLAAGLRAHLVEAPMLSGRYYGPVTGRVIDLDRSQSDALRLTLDQVVLDRIPPDRTPSRVRISLHGMVGHEASPGQVVMVTASLAAPDGAVEPGSFDFRQMAFFEGLGAVGYTNRPVVLWQAASPAAQWIGQLRLKLSRAIRAQIPGDAGAFAAGAMTGDRSGLSLDGVQALRDSSLAHLLAISGMNLAFLIGFVFSVLRYGLSLLPKVALRLDTRKLAALVSWPIAAFYLALSGSNVATERAFVMVTVMLGAVLLDRRALSLRSVSLAGLVLLLWQPEALLSPGFQMSFAATVGLIGGFAALNRHLVGQGWLRREAVVLVASSLIGGVSTAPFAAAHFNRFTDYGFLANLLTVPVMGAVVMPAGAVAALLAPVGLAGPALWVAGQGSAWILYVAYRVVAIDGAVTGIPAPPGWVLPVLTLGMAWALVWRGAARWAGLLPLVVALSGWAMAERPALLVTADGALAGLVGPQGRALSRDKGQGFAARTWLENDGDLTAQPEAAQRPGFTPDALGQRFMLGSHPGRILSRNADLTGRDPCAGVDLVIAPMPVSGTCLILDPDRLSRSGAVAVSPELDVTATRQGRRIWSQ